MSVKIHRYLTTAEYININDEAMANGMFRMDRRVFTPGTVIEMAWCYDPSNERFAAGERVMFTAKDREDILAGRKETHHLSMHYWRDWSHIRPPISIVGPNGRIHEPDRLSLGGDGWKVTGEFPFITVYPSIVLKGYHGWLKAGVFSPDIEGRGPNGSPI